MPNSRVVMSVSTRENGGPNPHRVTGLHQAMKKAIVEKDSGKNIYKLF